MVEHLSHIFLFLPRILLTDIDDTLTLNGSLPVEAIVHFKATMIEKDFDSSVIYRSKKTHGKNKRMPIDDKKVIRLSSLLETSLHTGQTPALRIKEKTVPVGCDQAHPRAQGGRRGRVLQAENIFLALRGTQVHQGFRAKFLKEGNLGITDTGSGSTAAEVLGADAGL